MTSLQVSLAAQVSLRQLQWWDERHVVQPQHAGHKRTYDRVAFFKTLLVARLRNKGVSLQRIRKAIASLPIEKLMEQSEACLMVKRKGVQLCTREQIAALLDLENGLVSVVCMASLIEILRREMRRRSN
jgi:DNA-binding transcriptional MerR regulator